MKEIEFVQIKNTLSMICTVKAHIHQKPETIWGLLTDAGGYSRWNSTVTGIDGHIREGEQIRIRVPGTDRTFKPTISDVETNKQMTWSNGLSLLFKGSRRFELKRLDNGSTLFIMEEKFEGLIFAILKNRLPDFKEIFEQYAQDLKNEAESHKNE